MIQQMRTPSMALLSGLAVFLFAGCGSSGGGSSSKSSTEHAITSSGIKVQTTPKFGSPSASAPVQSGVVQVAYRNITIQPNTIRVKVGSTIKWTNFDTVEHNVTSEGGSQSFASKTFGKGGTFEIHATKPGKINYECTIHPASMNGSIEIVQ
jgi:plastocyanin